MQPTTVRGVSTRPRWPSSFSFHCITGVLAQGLGVGDCLWIQTATTEYYCLWDIDLHMDECRNGYDLITPGLASLSFGGSALVWTPARLDPVGFFK